MKIFKHSFLHQVGNIIQAFVGIGEDLVTILSLGFINVYWKYSFVKYRLFEKPFLYKQQVVDKPDVNNKQTNTDEGVNINGESIQLGITKPNNNVIYNEIPILIIKEDDCWRAEILDNYVNNKPSTLNNINFEDIGFHFIYDGDLDDNYLFDSSDAAYDAAKYCNENYLNGKAKILIQYV